MQVSVMVCTYDRPEYLARCLQSIDEQTYRNFELIIVQGPAYTGRKEQTDLVIDRYRSKIKLCTVDEHNVAKARNEALKYASGEIVAMIDDDGIADENWLQAHVDAHSQRDCAGIGGFARSIDGDIVSRVVWCSRSGKAYECATEQEASISQAAGADLCFSLTGYNASFRRTAALEVGGFDEVYAYMLEETDLCFALMDKGYLLGFAPDAWIVHEKAAGVDRDDYLIPRDLYRRFTSWAYFNHIHTAEGTSADLEALVNHSARSLEEMKFDGTLTKQEHDRLVDELRRGLQDGPLHTPKRPFLTAPPEPQPFLWFDAAHEAKA